MRRPCLAPHRVHAGYTLVEMLMSVVLTLMMMGLVAQIFALVGRSVTESRAALEMSSQLRSTAARLRLDLQSLTAELMPPAEPEENKGYFEYTEGPIGPVVPPEQVALNTDEANAYDTTAADSDDILMFTIRSRDEPFVGRTFTKTAGTQYGPDGTGQTFNVQRSAQSPLAEVAWFVRGRTLYRRVLLVLPNHDVDLRFAGAEALTRTYLYGTLAPGSGHLGLVTQNDAPPAPGQIPEHGAFYNNFDLSVRFEGDPANPATWRWIPNTLADLTKPENRFAHQPSGLAVGVGNAFPFHPHVLFNAAGAKLPSDWRFLGLPTLRECSHFLWPVAQSLPFVQLGADGTFASVGIGGLHDAWHHPLPYAITNPSDTGVVDPETGTLRFDDASVDPALRRYMGPRVAEDVILNNVIGFDVKAWDPNAPLLQRNSAPQVVLAPGDPDYPRLPLFTATQVANILAGIDATNWTVVGRGAYVDLDYSLLDPATGFSTAFSHPPEARFGIAPLVTAEAIAGVYDTWSTHYEYNGLGDYNPADVGLYDPTHQDLGTNGFDDDVIPNGVDDVGEADTMPPYPVPLRGLQVTIRVFEPDSRQIREVTVTQDFLPE